MQKTFFEPASLLFSLQDVRLAWTGARWKLITPGMLSDSCITPGVAELGVGLRGFERSASWS